MKTHPALALVEFSDIPAAVRVTDAMVKRAPIAVLRCGTITRGRWLTLIGGSTASVEESLAAGLDAGGGAVIDHLLLPDVHVSLFEAVTGVRKPPKAGALAILETDTAAAAVRATEAALKGTGVELVEIRLADQGLSGKGVAIYSGDLHEVEAAVSLAEDVLAAIGRSASVTIIQAPHEALYAALEHGTVFAPATLLDLGGEA
jgi:microcompartment protein CcmL/EutN